MEYIKASIFHRLMESVGLGGPRWHGNSWQRGIAESGSSRPSTLMIGIPGDLVWDLPCVQQANYLEGGPLVWMLPLYLHINQKSDYDMIWWFLKNRHFFFIQERFNKLIYSINTIIKCGLWQPVKFQLVSLFWTGSKIKWLFYHISELLLATLIHWNFTGCQVPHLIIVLISYINLLQLFLIRKCLFLRNMEHLNFRKSMVRIKGVQIFHADNGIQ